MSYPDRSAYSYCIRFTAVTIFSFIHPRILAYSLVFIRVYTRRVYSPRILAYTRCVFSAYSPRILVHLPRFGSNSNHVTRPTPYDFPCFSSSTLTLALTLTLIFAAYSRVFSAYSPIDGQFSTEIEMKPSNQHYVSTEIEMKPSNQHYVWLRLSKKATLKSKTENEMKLWITNFSPFRSPFGIWYLKFQFVLPISI